MREDVVGAGLKIIAQILPAGWRSCLSRPERRAAERLIVFTKYPEPGKTKTRLIPDLGPERAAEVHRQLAEQTLTRVRAMKTGRGICLEIRYENGDEGLMAQWLGPDLVYKPQSFGDLGQRMAEAFSDAFCEGAQRVVLIGTDIPALDGETIRKAFDALAEHDLVLGPAADGGYYLVGLRSHVPQLFAHVPWGTERVLETTNGIAQRLGLSTVFLDPLADVDRLEDLHLCEMERRQSHGPSAGNLCAVAQEGAREVTERISVIIPTLDEAELIGTTLSALDGSDNVEVIVVDGGSIDGTMEVARSFGAQVLDGSRGRGAQMNAGAARASGRVLLFLHADTLLPSGWADRVREAISEPKTVGGAFELRLDTVLPGSRLIERLANLRSRLLQMPYGDQAIFVRADLFRRIGGFPNAPLMEDFDFVRRLRREGNLKIITCSVTTSARRWKRLGVLRATLMNQAVILAHLAGVSPHFTGRFYER